MRRVFKPKIEEGTSSKPFQIKSDIDTSLLASVGRLDFRIANTMFKWQIVDISYSAVISEYPMQILTDHQRKRHYLYILIVKQNYTIVEMYCNSERCVARGSGFIYSIKNHQDIQLAFCEIKKFPSLQRHICLLVNDVIYQEVKHDTLNINTNILPYISAS